MSDRSAQSIGQNHLPEALPDFRNLGVIARIALAVNALAVLAAMLRSQHAAEIPQRLLQLSMWVEPVLLFSLVALYGASPWLQRLRYLKGTMLATAIVLAATVLLYPAQASFEPAPGWSGLAWSLVYAALAAAAIAWYFFLRSRAFSPALAEARLQALQARIRPHFLFNSLTAVLSLIRRDPKRAEAAMEDLADLFRTVMADNRHLSPLRDEVALCRQYLSLEQLRLGERLQVEWRLDEDAESALVPPMLLQPLVENAVYHGIEPGVGAGTVQIEAAREGDRLRLRLSNPYHDGYQHREGNRMALANIRERLQLHFDVEARLGTRQAGGRYEIDIAMPYRAAA